jgi:hypothetical protein
MPKPEEWYRVVQVPSHCTVYLASFGLFQPPARTVGWYRYHPVPRCLTGVETVPPAQFIG